MSGPCIVRLMQYQAAHMSTQNVLYAQALSHWQALDAMACSVCPEGLKALHWDLDCHPNALQAKVQPHLQKSQDNPLSFSQGHRID